MILNLGDHVKTALSAVGISEQRVQSWIGGPCSCEERRRKLNQLGWACEAFLRGKVRNAKELFEELLIEE